MLDTVSMVSMNRAVSTSGEGDVIREQSRCDTRLGL